MNALGKYRWGCAGLVMIPLLAGCMAMTTNEKNVDVPVRARSEREVQPGERFTTRVADSTFVEDSAKLVLAVTHGRLCRNVDHQIVDRTRVTERTLKDSPFWYWVFGFAGLGAGPYMIATAKDSESDRNWGIAITATGALSLAVAAGNAIAASDSTEHLGEVEVDSTPGSSSPCDEKPAAHVDVAVMGEGRALAEGKTDARGRVELTVKLSEIGPNDGMQVVADGQQAGVVNALRKFALAAKDRDEREREAREKSARDQRLQLEITSGRCSEARYNILQEALMVVKQLFDGASSGSSQDLFTILGHDTVVATPEGTSLELSAWLGGELHLFAIGFDPVKLDLRDEKGYAIKTRSVWERLLRGQSEHTDSRAFVAASGSKYALKVKGKGCAMVLAVRKL